ncbi:hypothetical protein RhiirC2_714710 [Rhizophagus irregularis]|uniref:Uncharacterized protein n=1 Tax=Rhizophagus irregularis TaxID=588596 RepID=A0A2N1MYI2_9GLOM|nr:hypothetical protein RhiirC2_714710 [Rhizophagus irregularis]
MVNTIWTAGNSPGREVVNAVNKLHYNYKDETPEMWCARICAPFKKILEENPSFYSKNEYIRMEEGVYLDWKLYGRYPSNYIYCTACDSLLRVSKKDAGDHLKRCIAGNSFSNECAEREELLRKIRFKEFLIFTHLENLLLEANEIKRLQLELSPQFQSLSHMEKDKLASIKYYHNIISFETYEATVPNNIKPCLYSVVELAEAYCGSVWKYANSAQFQYLPHLEMIEDIEIWRASTPKPSLNGASAGDLAKPSLNGASAGDLAEAYFNSV